MPVNAAVPVAPSRTLEQRRRALDRANDIRSYRADLKRRLKCRRVTAHDVLIGSSRVDADLVASMKVYDVLLAVPKWGRVKVNRRLAGARIAPSKTVSGLSARQRTELVAVLPRARSLV